MLFKKLLAAVDFSPASREALQIAASIATDSDADLVLLHVWQPTVYGGWGIESLPSSAIRDVLQDARHALDDWKYEAKARGAPRVSAQVRSGAPWSEIVEAVRADPSIDLVVLGTHGRTGLKHVLLGSVAEKVIRHARCAVLVVRAPG